jgi:general secretion pathway protein A
MYESFYGLSTKPFHIVPNPAFLYLSPKHENALTYLEYGLLERMGFILLTGEIGTGKTTLIRYLLEKIDPEFETAVIFNTNVTPEQLLGLIMNEFELDVEGRSKAYALDKLYQFLIDRFAQSKRVLLIIDEAQNLSREALEEVRMLSNLQSDDQMLIQIMLVGQPQLKAKLCSPDLAQLNQRIGVTYHIAALSLDETRTYIGYRLVKAGGKPDIFTPDAVDLIYHASRGIPRTINLLCDAGLVYGFADELTSIEVPVIEQVIQDRDGMGLVHGLDCEETTGDSWAGKEEDVMLMRRLDRLEEGLIKLQMQVTWQIEELERSGQGFKDDLVMKYKELYTHERKRNDKLLFEYAGLKEKNSAIQGSGDDVRPQFENQDSYDLISCMKDILKTKQEKTTQILEVSQKLKEDFHALEQQLRLEMLRYTREIEAKAFAKMTRSSKFRSWFKF